MFVILEAKGGACIEEATVLARRDLTTTFATLEEAKALVIEQLEQYPLEYTYWICQLLSTTETRLVAYPTKA